MYRYRRGTITDMLRRTWIVCLCSVVWISAASGSYCLPSTADPPQPAGTSLITTDEKCSQFDHLGFHVPGSLPGPVTSFEVSTNYTDSERYLSISWNAPANDTERYATGYAVRVKGTDHFCCFFFNLTHSDKRKYKLILNITKENHYNIEVSSLPRTEFNTMTASLSIKLNSGYDSADCSFNSCWVSDLVIYDGPCEGWLTVTFNMAPADEGFDNYTVSLMKKSSLNTDAVFVVQQDNSNKLGIAKFKKGNETLKDRVVKLIPRAKKCIGNKCIVTISEPFDVLAADDQASCVIRSSSSSAVTHVELAVIIVGSVILAAFIITCVVLLARRRLSDEPGYISDTLTTSSRQTLVPRSNDNRREFVSEQAAIPTRKSVFLLYSNDNKYHQNVVGTFKEFLSKLCHCDVIYDVEHQRNIPDNKEEWIRSKMESCDYILMLNSEGTYWRAMAIKNDSYYPPNDSDLCLYDMFRLGFRILDSPNGSRFVRKLILAHFSYTPLKYRSPLLACAQDKEQFQLMKNIEELYVRIHRADCPSSVSEFRCEEPTDEFERLIMAIEKAQLYVATNPDWFRQTHGCQLPIVRASGQQSGSNTASLTTSSNYFHGDRHLPEVIFPKTTTIKAISENFIGPSDTASMTSSSLNEAVVSVNDSGYEKSGRFLKSVWQ